jgi:hypothetical protein
MHEIVPAEAYQSCPDLWVITTYFNPGRDPHRFSSYALFAESLKQSGIPLLSVECAFRDDAYELTPAPDIIQVRCPNVLWQKERLLNLAVSRLPSSARKVAWIDGDILFSNPAWATETSALLDQYPVVQLWEKAVRLPKGTRSSTGQEEIWESMASILSKDPAKIRSGGLHAHGHTGFAWAARRDLLDRFGLYDTGFDVGADHLIAHAFWGDFDSPCMQSVMGMGIMQNNPLRHNSIALFRWLRSVVPEPVKSRLAPWRRWRRENTALREHFLSWAQGVYAVVKGQVGFTSGTVMHLWHSDKTRLAPWKIRKGLYKHTFDPNVDLRINPDGCWDWASDNTDLHRWVKKHKPLNYQSRK